MIFDYKMLLMLVIIIILFGFQIYKRIQFNQGIIYNTTILLKHKNFKTYSLFGIVMGIFFASITMLINNNSDFIRNYTGIVLGLLFIIGSFFKPSNYTAISTVGIDIDGEQVKWTKIEIIDKNDFSYIIKTRKNKHYIDFSDLEDKELFKEQFIEAVKRFDKIDFNIIKI